LIGGEDVKSGGLAADSYRGFQDGEQAGSGAGSDNGYCGG
jgi:hypothetical protein